MNGPKVQRAILSVSDKRGLVDFARGLSQLGIEIYSTGGTRRHLQEHGLDVQDVSRYTGFPEVLQGRVKTLHPKLFAGILCRHDRADDMATLAEHQIVPFELVAVNLYPFAQTIARPEVTEAEAIEQIDIGGPSLIRAAAKNFQFVTVVTSPDQYEAVLAQLRQMGSTSLELRRRLMVEAFVHTADYDRLIAEHFGREAGQPFPGVLTVQLRRKAVLRYGENPHQQAALYASPNAGPHSLVAARQLSGKELSYNNLLDLDSAWAIVRSLREPAAAVIKHNNPCGAAIDQQLSQAARKALDGDPESAFGSILGFNRTVDAETAEVLVEPGRFIEAIVAPQFSDQAVAILTSRPKWKASVRLLQVGAVEPPQPGHQLRQIDGGMVVQDADVVEDAPAEWSVVTERQPTSEQMEQLRFGWAIVRHVKSNAITLSKDFALCGVGAGQMSRVDAVELAIRKAGERAAGSVLASDAFFPFPDSIQRAADAGVAAIIQPGGSRRDAEVVAECNRRGIPMVFTGCRHFKH